MNIMCLSGWGQPHDALSTLFPDATHTRYAHHTDIAVSLRDIAAIAKSHEVMVGWSLGGQLIVRAVAAGMASPRKIILIAAPFQFVAKQAGGLGMPRDQFDKFKDNYAKNSQRTLDKSWELVVKGDAHDSHIRAQQPHHAKGEVLKNDWLAWLNQLEGFSCDDIAMHDFPDTLLIHGQQDVVVSYQQSQRFLQAIPRARLHSLTEAGHAPHWHAPHILRDVVQEFLDV